MIKWIYAIGLSLALSSCLQSTGQYNLVEPSRMEYLPEDLNEISGLQWVNDTTLAAVQDEDGYLFFINPSSGAILDKIRFGKKGDYEGVTRVGDVFYVLKSNGTIIRMKDGKQDKIPFKQCKNVEFEGLCFDKAENRLLVACKRSCEKKNWDMVLVYAVSLDKQKYKKKPVLEMEKNTFHPKFQPSGIAIHPNGHWFLLSSTARLLLETDAKGRLISTNPLNPFIFHQPEGITFSPDGTLYISNEQVETGPSIMTFK
jgi:uncharacterized protein YjiK